MLELNSSLAKEVNEGAIRLLDQLSSPALRNSPSENSDFVPDVHIDGAINFSDVNEFELGETNAFGRRLTRYYLQDNKPLGLSDEPYKELVKLSEQFYDELSFRRTVARSTIEDFLFDWIRQASAKTTQLLPADFVIAACNKEIREYEVWVPVAYLRVQHEFTVGNVQIKSITSGIYDEWKLASVQQSKKGKDEIGEWFEKNRKKYHGFAAAVISMTADKRRACEIAEEEAQLALSILRVFDSASLHPLAISYCLLRGSEHIDTVHSFVFQNNRVPTINSRAVLKVSPDIVLTKNEIAMMLGAGVKRVTEIVRSEERTPFQQRLLDALVLYSKVSIAAEPSDKLVYLVTALESMFLKDEDRGLTNKFSTRIAAFLAGNEQEMFEIRSRAKSIYKLRSRFLHHAERVADIEIMTKFMRDVWKAFYYLILNSSSYYDHKELLKELDDATNAKNFGRVAKT